MENIEIFLIKEKSEFCIYSLKTQEEKKGTSNVGFEKFIATQAFNQVHIV